MLVDAKLFTSALKSATKAVAKTHFNPYVLCINLSTRNNKLLIAGTNGELFARYTLETDSISKERHDVSLTVTEVKRIIPLLPTKGNIMLGLNNKFIHGVCFESADYPANHFPDLDRFMPSSFSTKSTTSREEFTKHLKKDVSWIPISFLLGGSIIVDGNKPVRGEVTGKPHTILMSRKYLLTAVQQSKQESVTIQSNDKLGPIVVDNTWLIMPIRS